MATAIRIEVLPARLGDCLLVECLRPRGAPWRMLVDGGPSDTWPLLEARLERLPAATRAIDVAVVTHVDSDHIGGFIPFVQSDFARDHVGDFWFNGRPHLTRLRARSIDQGETVGSVLTGKAEGTRAALEPRLRRGRDRDDRHRTSSRSPSPTEARTSRCSRRTSSG